jgi:hypothetical protein
MAEIEITLTVDQVVDGLKELLGRTNIEADFGPLEGLHHVELDFIADFDSDELVSFATTERLEDALYSRDWSPDVGDQFDKSAVMDLASAVRRGDSAAAEMAMDMVFRDVPAAREWIDQGRYSRLAKAA